MIPITRFVRYAAWSQQFRLTERGIHPVNRDENAAAAVPIALQSRTSQGADADAARVRSLAAYKDFLTLWKDADPDIPILKEAKAEYAKLQ
jgi:hypothetical protein